MKSRKCPSCGNEVKKDSQFCVICGTRLSDGSEPVQADAVKVEPPASPTVMEASGFFAEQEMRARKKTVKKTIIMVVALLVILAAGAISAWKFLFSGNGTQGEAPSSNESAAAEAGSAATTADSVFADFLGTWICEDYDYAGTELTLQVAFYYDPDESSYYECYWEYPRDFAVSSPTNQIYPQDLTADNVAGKLNATYADQFAYFTRITGESGGIVDSSGSLRFDLSEDGQTLIMTVDAYGNKQQTNRLKSKYEFVRHPDFTSADEAYTSNLLTYARGTDTYNCNWYFQGEGSSQPVRFYADGVAVLHAGRGTWYMEEGLIWVRIAASDGSENKYWFCFSDANLDVLNNVYRDEQGVNQVNVYRHDPYEGTDSE